MTHKLATDPSSDIHQHPIEGEDVGFVKDNPEGREEVRSSSYTHSLPLGGEEMTDDGFRIIASAELLGRCQKRSDQPDSNLWGGYIRTGAVTLLVGETSAGKTVFFHNLAYHLAEGLEFLGLAPPRRLKLLSLDFESYGDIIEDNLSAIGTSENWKLVDFEEGDVRRGEDLIAQLERTIRTVACDVVIVDPLVEAYPVKDENDNAQATRQMLAFRKLARKTGAAIVVVHNAGRRKEGQRDDKFLSRGATARVDRADVGINFIIKGPTERQLVIKKTRGHDLNTCMTLRFSGDLGYELVESTAPSTGVIAEYRIKSFDFVCERATQGKMETERKEMLGHFKIQERTKEAQALDRALKNNVKAGKLRKTRKGTYALPLQREVVNLEN